MGQMASMFNERQQGNFSSTSEVSPKRGGKEHWKAITLRSGKTVEKPVQNSVKNDEDNAESKENNVGTIGKAEKLLKNSASKEQRKTKLKAPSRKK